MSRLASARRLVVAALLFNASLFTWHPAAAADLVLGQTDTGAYNLHLTSYSEIPFRTVLRQRFDFSCGSAALASLLKFHYGRTADEVEVFKAMYATGDQARIQKFGFSLLDMKKYLASLGYQADGYRFSLSDISQTKIPAIALVQIGAYKHFVIVKGVIGNAVLIGDPAIGLRVFTADEFLKIWNGIAFVIHETPAAQSPATFNSADEWHRWADAHPLSAANFNVPIGPILRDAHVFYQIEPNQILPSQF